jgi:hypothetical protein
MTTGGTATAWKKQDTQALRLPVARRAHLVRRRTRVENQV